MDSNFLTKAVVGAAGMAIGAALVTSLRVAAVDGAERARDRYLTGLAAGKRPNATMMAQAGLGCPRVDEVH